ncbi:E3 ubiquitin-protein ligase TRIM13 [Galemys pyrenaicus]|uniref:E3 ubiquitin-protein ligase TRIM13 n=1 Tax=Galemys pyrenaicus TaxID=202257 RepID=A0A8J6AQ12_GALPY|nr:E3 ubiquitin-protein ligase TRIM13 [Galemys pyrenaicus]
MCVDKGWIPLPYPLLRTGLGHESPGSWQPSSGERCLALLFLSRSSASMHRIGARDVMELLEEDLTCPICCSLFDDPRVLPCSHNFCKKCLEGILEGSVRNSLWRSSPFKCPTCRKETSATGVNSLQVNYSLKGIVEKYNKIKISPKMPVCKGHLGQPLNIFCLTDMQLICGICATRGDHTKHVFCSIEDAYVQERDAFESLFQSFETWRRGDALSRLDTLETSKRKSLQLLTKDSDKVKEFFEKLQHTLDQKKNEILSDFETMKLAVMQAYDPEINKLNTILQEQRMAFNIAEAFKDVSEPIVFLQQMQEFREKIKVIKETPLPPSNLPTSPLMKNFDTSQWEDIKLVKTCNKNVMYYSMKTLNRFPPPAVPQLIPEYRAQTGEARRGQRYPSPDPGAQCPRASRGNSHSWGTSRFGVRDHYIQLGPAEGTARSADPRHPQLRVLDFPSTLSRMRKLYPIPRTVHMRRIMIVRHSASLLAVLLPLFSRLRAAPSLLGL